MKTSHFKFCICLALALFSLCGISCKHNTVAPSSLYQVELAEIEAASRMYFAGEYPHRDASDFRLLSISIIKPMDGVSDQKEVILARFLIESTREDEVIDKEVFMGYPLGTRVSTWATETLVFSSEGDLIVENIPIRNYLVPSPVYEEVTIP